MIAVVSGAGRGIGKSIALELCDRGFEVALLGRNQDALTDVAGEIVRRGRRAVAKVCDVSQASAIEQASVQILRDLGVPSVVVANAGIVHRKSVADTSEEEWDATLDTNLKGTFLLTRAFLRPMLRERRGRMIAIGSISGTMGTPRLSAYCASKWGTIGYVKSLAEELRGSGLQAMCVLPGSVDTDMLVGSGFLPAMAPSDIAKIVGWAACEAPEAMNGSVIEAFGP